MGLIAWIFLGMAVGYLTSKLVVGKGVGTMQDVTLGTFGAVTAGLVFTAVSTGVTPAFNIWSLFISVFGALLVLGTFHRAMGDKLRH
jgi:uncharacterized membrane protein YeaQ/YmgE (transglycosylase-associated protein family)